MRALPQFSGGFCSEATGMYMWKDSPATVSQNIAKRLRQRAKSRRAR
ncbi:MAG: hypothetical protein U1F77_02460 [Kiritimatiellia bacterium]